MPELPRAQSQSESDKLIGQVLANRYRIESRLGEGAMGTVYKARHVKVGREFAVKVLHPRLLKEEKLLQRFQREAELAGKLRHANVIGVVDVGETPDGLHYMVMDFASGPDMATLLASAPLPAPRVISLVRQLCDGLSHAHEMGLIHRDFKPENVIVERDTEGNEIPRIVDFGIAILQDAGESSRSEGRLTTNGLVLGTPHYMAPEQAVADPIDHRIDLFALGIILYEMLTGRLPFDGNGAEVARANLVLDPPAMAKRVPHLEVDPLLEAYTRKLMSKNRELRPPTARAARELLDLIEVDRVAAGRALGVPITDARPMLATEPVKPVTEETAPAVPLVAITVPTQPIVAPAPPAARRSVSSHATAVTAPLPYSARGRRRRGIIIGSIATGVAVVGALAIFRYTGSNDAPTVAPVAVVDPAPGSATPPVLVAPVGPTAGSGSGSGSAIAAGITAGSGSAVVAIVDPTTVVPPPIPPVGPTAVPHSTGTSKVHPPIVHPDDNKLGSLVPVPVTPKLEFHPVQPVSSGPLTPNELAAEYGAVGSQLKALEDKHGSDATADLWPRYRLIRLNEALSTPEKRADAASILAKLHHDIATRAKS